MSTFSLRELEGRPAKFQGDPPAGTKPQELPWAGLSWENFEKICWRLAKEEQDPLARPYGVRGQDQQGIDIIGQRTGENSITVYQCKRVKSFTAADIREAIEKFRQGNLFAKTQRFVLCCTRPLDGVKEAEVLQSKEFGIEIETWDATELNRRLKTRHDLVEDFFSEHWVDKFCIGEPLVDYGKARKRLESLFSTVDFSGVGEVQDGGPQSRIENPLLDDAYYEIRFQREDLRAKHDDQPAPITVQDLLDAPDRCRIVKGRGGAGKSMWLRYTFRQMVRRSDVFPLLVELRDYCLWREQPLTTNLDSFLQQWLKDRGVPNATALYRDLVDARHPDTPSLVLLVDGWDELGAHGQKFSEQLQSFQKAYPHARIVVTSRPYGEQKPTHRDGFTEWDLAALTPEDIEAFSRRFYTACYPGDLERADAFYQRFLVALKGSPTAPQLAQLPLLLVMMLMISRTEVLPDKRHKLYERVIRNLLEAIPKRQEETGVRLGAAQWRPEDADVRFRAVCELAFQMKARGEKPKWREEAIRLPWKQAADLLPCEWNPQQRNGFLFWLCTRTGILMDLEDDKVQFAHLSFHEYLTAAYAEANYEGSDRVQFVQERLPDVSWWEAIRLWAALVSAKKPANLTPVFQELLTSGQGIALAGAILADGTAQEQCQPWLTAFLPALVRGGIKGFDYCAKAFAANQNAPRDKFHAAANVAAGEGNLTAMQWFRLDAWKAAAGISSPLALPKTQLSRPAVEAALLSTLRSEAQIAQARCWSGWSPLVGGLPLVLLQTWPSRRRTLSGRIQSWTLWSEQAVPAAWLRKVWTPVAHHRARDLARDLARDWASVLARDCASDLARDWAIDLARDLASDLARDLARVRASVLSRDLASDLARVLASDLASDLARDLASDLARVWARVWARDWASDWGLNDYGEIGAHFVRADLSSLAGRASLRPLLKHGQSQSNPIAQALQLGSRGQPIDNPSLHELWPALGRHLGRQSTPEDKVLLEDYARHPERMQEQTLQWGLRFIVRGDLMLPDGSFQTLDELADQHGLPHLPYLEDVPDPKEWLQD